MQPLCLPSPLVVVAGTLLGALLTANPGAAMTLHTQGDTVFATGPVQNDLKAFEAALSQPGITTVALVNSPGGSLSTSLQVGRLIATKGLNTVAAGHCMSGCSIMFMGGKERRYADNFHPKATVIGIHGAHHRITKEIDPNVQPRLFAFYKARMGAQFRADVINQALYDMDDAGAFLRIPDPMRSPQSHPVHCRSGQTPRTQCTQLKNDTALTLGVITHAEPVTLDLPAELKSPPQLQGQTLPPPLPDPNLTLTQWLGQKCNTDSCRKLGAEWNNLPDHKALTYPINGTGYSYSNNQENPDRALVVALYACNHPQGKPARLCQGLLVNQSDIRDGYRRAEQAHADALAQLSPPPSPFYADEAWDGELIRTQGLRTQKPTEMTPLELPGITTVGTQTLVQQLIRPQRPVLIDVSGGYQTLPSAQTLLYGGTAYDDKAKDSAAHQRFSALLRLLAPNTEQPLIFFCSSRKCWHAVNAALRAQQLGYSQVFWYRGGLESWQAARLPVAPMVLRAVAN